MRRIALLLSLLAALGPAHARKPAKIEPPRPCACADIATLENEIAEQQYLASMFSDWAEYMPNSIHDTDELKARALARFKLTFYGVGSEAPQAGAIGGAADLGVLYKKAACPLVLYHYKDGKPLMVPDPPLKKGEKRKPLKLKHFVTPVSEATYPAGQQCAAMVHYGFVHEQQHQKTCREQHESHGEAQWDKPKFFAGDDAKAYQAGVAVLQSELDGLRGKCEECDGKWHGTLEYSYTFSDPYEEIVSKGDNRAYPDGSGWKRSGNAKSTRVRATFTTSALEGMARAQYTGAHEAQSFTKNYFSMPSECGSYRKLTWILDHGTQQRFSAKGSGTVDANIASDGRRIRVSFRTEPLAGTFTDMFWSHPQGYCTEAANMPSDMSRSEASNFDPVTVSLEGVIDQKNPNELDLFRTEVESGGKGQRYYHLKLRRCSK
jgi:hypothetical protein